MKNGDKCPISDCGEIFEAKELSNYQKKEMERITIACDENDCGEEYPFNQTLDHRRKCCIKEMACINNCGDGKLYTSVATLLAHIMDECVKTKLICTDCKFKCPREDFVKQNCVLGYIGKV